MSDYLRWQQWLDYQEKVSFYLLKCSAEIQLKSAEKAETIQTDTQIISTLKQAEQEQKTKTSKNATN